MRVFISGTSADLGSFRKAAAEQLIKLRHEAVEQTYFLADHRTLADLLREKIKSSDVVICLVGSVFGFAPPGADRSYTQMEYEFAREYGKPTFVFFPSARCTIEESPADASNDERAASDRRDSARERELQKKYADKIRLESYIYYEFDDTNHLRVLLLEAVFDLSPKTAGGAVARAARTEFPTPLSHLYDAYDDEDDSRSLASIAAEALRFISLLAVHDSLVHRIFGSQSADRKELTRLLGQPKGAQDWRSLLRLACPEDAHDGSARFIPDFAGWERRNSDHIDKVVQYDESIFSARRPVKDTQKNEVRKAIASIFADLTFLRRYALLAVAPVDSNPAQCTVTVLRGLAARSFVFATESGSALPLDTTHLYLLELHRQQALCLTPSLRYGGGDGTQDVYGWCELLEINATSSDPQQRQLQRAQCRSMMATFGDESAELETLHSCDRLSSWLGDDLCDAFGLPRPVTEVAWKGGLLDIDSWTRIQEIVLPLGGEAPVLAGRFRLEGAPIHRGFHADVHSVTDLVVQPRDPDTGSAVEIPGRPVVHVLRREAAADPDVCAWFASRADCWSRTKHAAVLRLHEKGDASGKTGRPFLLTERVPEAQSLEQVMRSGGTVTEEMLTKTVVLAAQVCRAAHEHGIFLLALPPRHFLIDGADNLFVTGFDTAHVARAGHHFDASLVSSITRFSKDLHLMAPEIKRGFGTFAPTIDVFAVGRLLAELRQLPTHAMDVLRTDEWGDTWRCLAYHCLATDPNLRFRSADQILLFLERGEPSNTPQLVGVPETKPGFSIGRYPVTNAEYHQFCVDRDDRPAPVHFPNGRVQVDDHSVELSYRLGGPWLPVTHVSLSDAHEYCRWLSDRTQRKWRLPRQSEWLRAASSRAGASYPWGDDDPERERANYAGHYRGPTVVGGFPRGQSHADCWDMAGNVWEWCTDIVATGAPRHVVKGGAYDYSADTLRLASVDARVVTCRSAHIGFRLLCEAAR